MALRKVAVRGTVEERRAARAANTAARRSQFFHARMVAENQPQAKLAHALDYVKAVAAGLDGVAVLAMVPQLVAIADQEAQR